MLADGVSNKKRKRSLVRKTTVLLSSSSESEAGSESLDDSEESNFVVDEGILSEADDCDEELVDSDEEADSAQQNTSKVS